MYYLSVKVQDFYTFKLDVQLGLWMDGYVAPARMQTVIFISTQMLEDFMSRFYDNMILCVRNECLQVWLLRDRLILWL